MTNTELINKLMNSSKYGALQQAFIMQGLETFADIVISEKDNLLKEDEKKVNEGKVSFINYKSWIGCAEEIKELFDKRRMYEE
ncbi:hypothetical protein [Flavobacterium filum]|uniref:hypothetical protein n=1 Tax=Flavobacterium filum TaxID=370974 RepID=UPI00040F98A4|nr:hypothetical protein [Flavobacterium filum]